MYFERKELIQSLDLLCFILFVYTWLLDNRTFLLIVKAALQVQFCNPVQMHPTWSLPFFVVFLCCLNLILALAHLWTPPSQTNTGDAIFIDFVGHTTLPGRLHVLMIDAFVCFVQLVMTVVAFEMGKDDAKPDDEPSALDDATTMLEQEDLGQGWDVRDEEARLFGLDQDDERKRQRTSLTHHIAVVRLRPIYDQIVSRQFLPTQPSEDTDAAQPEDAPPTTPAPVQPHPDRPDTSRIRRFSRRPRTVASGTTDQPEAAYTGLGPVSADDSWPPMWLVIARNLVGGSSARIPSFRPTQGLASIRDNLAGRFGRVLSHAPDRSQYTRINPDAPPDT
ncbi:conserved hypothetical protein [Sporisorium reilianum SRZ2]|uniref:DUF1746 domain-containing protein n=1 Tax=Sporisorium reilianum (strain SRZ2) TaxID=999809 RepID=E6ZP96_SPORE|nr:conserved hypothetical protein [Sporisorium reilianum SRZ2]